MVRRRRGNRQKNGRRTGLKTASRKPLTKKLSARSESSRDRAFAALRAMRHGASISRAARENGITPRTVKRYLGTELLQDRPGGRIRATKSDQRIRYLQIPDDPTGSKEIKVRGPKAASEVARYKAAVNRFLSGDPSALKEWHGKKIAGHALLTDENTLKALAAKDLLPYSLYRSFSGGAR
jgi:hypothetical protein